MSFTTQIATGVVVRRSLRRSFPPNRYNPPLPNAMQGEQSSDPNEFLTSHTLKSILTRGPSPSNSQPNSPRSSNSSSPPAINHDSVVSIDFEQINSLEQNLRDFEGFMNRENVLPQVGNVVSTLRYMLISNRRDLEMLRDLSMIVKNHVPLDEVPHVDTQFDLFRSQVGVSIPGLGDRMVDSTIPSISASSIPLGYTGMASDSTAISVVAHIAVVSSSTTSIGMSYGGGGGATPPPPPLPTNPVQNTILQNMGQLQLQLTSLASSSG